MFTSQHCGLANLYEMMVALPFPLIFSNLAAHVCLTYLISHMNCTLAKTLWN